MAECTVHTLEDFSLLSSRRLFLTVVIFIMSRMCVMPFLLFYGFWFIRLYGLQGLYNFKALRSRTDTVSTLVTCESCQLLACWRGLSGTNPLIIAGLIDGTLNSSP